MKFSNETYDLLQKVVRLILPALATFWLTIAKIWNLPLGPEIGATITAIDTLLGACLGISSKNYHEDGAE